MSRPIPSDHIETDSRPSKSARKRDMHALQELGEKLVRLPAARLAKIDLPEELRRAFEDARRFTKHEARRRQMQYIGRLMRSIDPAPLIEVVAAFEGRSAGETARMHRVERLRAALLQDEAVLTRLGLEQPQADLEQLAYLRRTAIREQEQGKAPRAFRELFRVLRELDGSAASANPGGIGEERETGAAAPDAAAQP